MSAICRWATGEVLRGVERSSASVALAAAPSRGAAAPGAATAQSRVVSACTASGTWALKNRAIHSLLGSDSQGRTALAPDESPGGPRARPHQAPRTVPRRAQSEARVRSPREPRLPQRGRDAQAGRRRRSALVFAVLCPAARRSASKGAAAARSSGTDGSGLTRINARLIREHYDDVLRIAGSLLQRHTTSSQLVRALRSQTRHLATLAGRSSTSAEPRKPFTSWTTANDEHFRRRILVQLNRGEGRHGLARDVGHGRRGELRQPYREGQEEQLGALGLIVNTIVLYNPLYTQRPRSHRRHDRRRTPRRGHRATQLAGQRPHHPHRRYPILLPAPLHDRGTYRASTRQKTPPRKPGSPNHTPRPPQPGCASVEEVAGLRCKPGPPQRLRTSQTSSHGHRRAQDRDTKNGVTSGPCGA